MSRRAGYIVAAAILVGSGAVASFLVSLRPEPARREPPSRIPFVVTEAALARAGAIRVHGAGTVRPRAEIDVAAEISGRVVWVNPAFQSGGRIRRGADVVPARRRRPPPHGGAGARGRRNPGGRAAEGGRGGPASRGTSTRSSGAASEPPHRRPTPPPWPCGSPRSARRGAAVARERAALAQAELGLSRTEVRAPFAGVVRSESVDEGRFVGAGQAVGRLYAVDAVEVVVPLSDEDAALIPGLWDLRAGDADRRVTVRVAADYGNASHVWQGYVDRVEAALDEATRTLDVIVRVPDPFSAGVRVEGGVGPSADTGDDVESVRAPPLLVGKFVDVEIEGRTPDAYFRVRRAALRPGNEVWAVRDGALTIIPVRVLQRSGDDVFVTGALRGRTAGRRGRGRDRHRRDAGADDSRRGPVSPDGLSAQESRGAIAYMARNGVAANLLMFFIVAGGLVSMDGLVQEAFPALSFDHVEISMSYPGATPDEVEDSIVVKIEEQVAALDDVREVTAIATEGYATVMAALRTGTDMSRALDGIESAINRIQTFPAGAERPEIREMTNRQSVIRLVLYGDVSERALKELAFRVEDDIASLPAVSYVETSGVRSYEISIEVPLHRLRAAGLTIEDVSNAVRRGALDLSAGSIETRDAEVRVRTIGQGYDQQDFEEIIVLSGADGTVVRLGNIADVRDGFQDVDLITRYEGQPAAFVEVYRTAGEQVLEVVRAVEEHLEREVIPGLPAGLSIEILNNDAEVYESRLDLLLENGFAGLLLVLVALALFLEIRLAIWVALGIAISFIGALAAALALDISINTVTLFGFLLAVGIVVDDAIVVAEHVHAERRKGLPGIAAAIRGTQRIKRPVIFAVLTTVAAFAPLLFVPGPRSAGCSPPSPSS